MNALQKATPIRCYVPTQVKKDFAGVRGRVAKAIKVGHRSVTYSEAIRQVRAFEEKARNK